MFLNTCMCLSQGLSVLYKSKIIWLNLSLSITVSLASRHSSITAWDRAGSSKFCQLNDALCPFQALRLHAQPRGHSSASTLAPAKGQSLGIQTGEDCTLDILAIVFLGRTWCNKDQLYLFKITNSHGHIGEQVRGDIEDWLKFWHRRAYTRDYIPLSKICYKLSKSLLLVSSAAIKAVSSRQH